MNTKDVCEEEQVMILGNKTTNIDILDGNDDIILTIHKKKKTIRFNLKDLVKKMNSNKM